MAKFKKVVFTFINEKGLLKTVSVLVEEDILLMLDEANSEEFKIKYLSDIYHEKERERWRRRKYGSDVKVDDLRIAYTDSNNIDDQRIKVIANIIKNHRNEFSDKQIWLIEQLYFFR